MRIENPNIEELAETWGTQFQADDDVTNDDDVSDIGDDGDLLRIAETPSIFSFDEQSITWAVDRFIAIGAVTLILRRFRSTEVYPRYCLRACYH